ncbi:DDRGK domain-containing protein 1-like [Chelonus insularis]|uniref:DDRGK domain-containing protein 1-like n=1 Tax=Chelonus insularis TaxID=460826 RepID=UPI00158F386B|nr:DDRGK domain-containing protein 1-like [Chelonus insularis]
MLYINMDIPLLVSIAVGLLTIILFLTLWITKKSAQVIHQTADRPQPVRRATGVRNARRRMQGTGVQNDAENVLVNNAPNGEDNDINDDKINMPSGKIGVKKKAKLEAKAEKRQAREVMEKEREERKKREQHLQAEADKQREKEKLEELKREEAEKKEREEKEKKEYEEYLKLKEAFSIEEEGFDEENRNEDNLLQEFINYIQLNKVVILEDLAGHFKLKTANVIERIQDLQASGNLTGVIDDRGKFIYISQEELEAVAKFVKQRGRVSIAELAENSNNLITLTPGNFVPVKMC